MCEQCGRCVEYEHAICEQCGRCVEYEPSVSSVVDV